MNIKEWKKKKILEFIEADKAQQSPNSERLTFVADDDAIKEEECVANRTWFIGNGDELLNYYTNQEIKGFWRNPIYNRNKRNYFWGLSSTECDIKRVHSGIPNAIITTLTNVIGYPMIKADDGGMWQEIEDKNDFQTKLTQQGRPLTMVEGWGAWKINYDTNLADYPIIEYYEAENVDYIIKSGVMLGIIFTTYYTIEDKNYILFETRYKAKGNSYIDYDLFRLMKDNEVEEVPLDYLNKNLEPQSVIEGLDDFLAVPSRYFYNVLDDKFGRSIYAGKLDLFDYLDETLSIANHTTRNSSPITWINPDFLQRDGLGNIGMPKHWDRTFLTKPALPDGEGNMSGDIFIDQPNLNVDQYIQTAKNTLDYILTGVLSPASMGIDIAKKDNAEAQKEKEKVTIMTKNNIVNSETKMMRKLVNLSLMLQQYINTGSITTTDFNVQVQYDEFASPSLEEKLQTLGQAWSNGELSTEKYIQLLWGDALTEEERAKELKWLEQNKQSDSDYLSQLGGEGNEERAGENVLDSGNMEEEDAGVKEQIPNNHL